MSLQRTATDVRYLQHLLTGTLLTRTGCFLSCYMCAKMVGAKDVREPASLYYAGYRTGH